MCDSCVDFNTVLASMELSLSTYAYLPKKKVAELELGDNIVGWTYLSSCIYISTRHLACHCF